jgi:hypothetical protein
LLPSISENTSSFFTPRSVAVVQIATETVLPFCFDAAGFGESEGWICTQLHSVVSQPTKNGPPLYWTCGKDSYALVVVKALYGRNVRFGAIFPNCNLLRNAHVGTSMFLARFGDGKAGGATASCADESRPARSPEGCSVGIGGAATFTKGAALKHPGWRNNNPRRLTADAIGDSPQE